MKARRGFTLIELMTVISVIAILAAILLPVFARARENARKATCQNNLQQIGMALHLYAQDNQGRFPAKNSYFAPVQPYLKNTSILQCPTDSETTAPPPGGGDEGSAPSGDAGAAPPGSGAAPAASPQQAAKQPRFWGKPLREVFDGNRLTSYVYRGGLSNDDLSTTPLMGDHKLDLHMDGRNVLRLDCSAKWFSKSSGSQAVYVLPEEKDAAGDESDDLPSAPGNAAGAGG